MTTSPAECKEIHVYNYNPLKKEKYAVSMRRGIAVHLDPLTIKIHKRTRRLIERWIKTTVLFFHINSVQSAFFFKQNKFLRLLIMIVV